MSKKKNDVQEEMADLFDKDLRKIKSAKYKDMDDSFSGYEKKHHSFIFIIILFIIIAFVYYYYFIFDSPKTIFNIITNNTLNSINLSDKDKIISYTLKVDGKSEEDDINKIFDIINKVTLSGVIGSDNDKRIFSGNIDYQNDKLIDYNFLIDTKDKDNIYLKFDNITNKVIKVNTDIKKIDKYDKNIEDYEYVINTIINSVSTSIENANYSKTIVKVNNIYVKKMTLKINEKFINDIVNKLLDDDKFIDCYSKIYNIETEEVFDYLNKIKIDSKNTNDTLDIYLSILKNEFIKLAYNGTGNSLNIDKNKDKYNFELVLDYIKVLEGNATIKNNNNKTNIVIVANELEKNISLDIDLTYSLKSISSVNILDSNKAVNYKDISGEEIKELLDNISNNEAFKKLIKDLGIKEISSYLSK